VLSNGFIIVTERPTISPGGDVLDMGEIYTYATASDVGRSLWNFLKAYSTEPRQEGHVPPEFE
jgi:hypothetical protein